MENDTLDEIEDVLLLFSVTRLGDLLDFGQLFKAFGNKISHIIMQFL